MDWRKKLALVAQMRIAFAVFLLFLFIFAKQVDIYQYPLLPIIILCLMEGIFNNPFIFFAERLKRFHNWIVFTGAVNVIIITALLHYASGYDAFFKTVLYLPIILEQAFLVPGIAVVLTASFASLCYGFLLVLEHLQLFPHSTVHDLYHANLSEMQHLVLFIFFAIILHLFAVLGVSINRLTSRDKELNETRKELELWNQELSSRVVERTAELEKSKNELENALVELKTTQLQLVEAGKMAVMGEISMGVAHEMNNPLFVISGESEMILLDEKKDAETRQAAKKILEQVKRMKKITDRMLGFFAKSDIIFQLVDFNDAVNKSVSLLNYETKLRGIEIKLDLDPTLPKMRGDFNQIEEVILNLTLNAVQAMGNTGTLTVKTESKKLLQPSAAEKQKFNPGDEVIIAAIKDTGAGMDEAVKNKIFSPFFSTKEKGVGLGLSLCQRIVDRHGGIIVVESEPGKGSVFTIELPIYRGKEEENEKDTGDR